MRVVVTLAGLALLALTLVAAVPHNRAEGTTFDISFDGFCDGMSFTGTPTPASGVQCGCISDSFWGTRSPRAAHVTHDPAGGAGGFHTVVNRRTMEWRHIDQNGLILNSGTFSLGCPAEDLSGLPRSFE